DLTRLELYKTVSLGLALIDNLRANDYQVRHLRLALSLGEPTRVIRAMSTETIFLASQMAARGRHVADLASDLAESHDHPLSRAFALFGQISVSYFIDNDWARTLEYIDQCEELLHTHTQSAGFETDSLRVFRCFCWMHMGELGQLARQVPAHIDEAERRGDRYIQVSLRTRLVLAWLVTGDPERAERELEEAFAAWIPWTETLFTVPHYYGLHSRCEIALYRNRPGDAAAVLAEQLRPLRRSLLTRVPLVRSEIEFAQARVAVACAAAAASSDGDSQTAAEHLRIARKLARSLARNRVPVATGHHHLILAGIARVSGDMPGAAAELDSAMSELKSLSMWHLFHAARVHRAALSDSGDSGNGGDAERADSLAWFHDQGVAEPETLCHMLIPGFVTPAAAGRGD
ncbi:MAG: hypothetical protein AAGC55_06865, partial [Myxococcota bacterium]